MYKFCRNGRVSDVHTCSTVPSSRGHDPLVHTELRVLDVQAIPRWSAESVHGSFGTRSNVHAQP